MTKRPSYIVATGAALLALSANSTFAQDDTSFRDAAVAEAARIAGGLSLSGTVEFIGQNSGVEGQTLQDVYAAFSEGSGVDVRYTGTPDTTAIIQSRVQSGNPPDVGELQLGNALQYAEEGQLLDLTAALGDHLTDNFSSMLLETATYDGKVIGIYQGMNPFMVWYNPQTYTGPSAPEDWQEIVEWTIAEAEKGNTVWCAAQGAGAGSGFPGAQVIDNIFLKANGPDLYSQWGKGELAWTSPEVKAAWEEFGNVVAQDSHLQGGRMGAITTSIATGYNGLISEPATCQVALWGAWVPGLLGEGAKPGENIDFFRVPGADPSFYNYEMFQSAISFGFNDRPETKAFLEFMASTEAQAYLASLNRWPVANKNVPSDAYPSPLLQDIARDFFASGDVEFAAGPNLLLSGATSSAYNSGVVNFMRSPGDLDEILAGIEATVQ